MAGRKKTVAEDKPLIITAKTEEVRFGDIKPNPDNPRENEEGIPKLVKSIKDYGYNDYITVDKNLMILAGHTRYEALKVIGLKPDDMIKVHVADHLTDKKGVEYSLVDNKSAEYSGWNFEKLEFVIEEYDIKEDIAEWFPPVEEEEYTEEPPEEADGDTEEVTEVSTDDEPKKRLVTCPCCGQQFEI